VLAFDMRTPPRLYMRLPDGGVQPKIVGDSGGETT
jgi:cell division protein FtsQ